MLGGSYWNLPATLFCYEIRIFSLIKLIPYLPSLITFIDVAVAVLKIKAQNYK